MVQARFKKGRELADENAWIMKWTV